MQSPSQDLIMKSPTRKFFMNKTKKFMLFGLILFSVLVYVACGSNNSAPGGQTPDDQMPVETFLGSTSFAHSLTRTHNRKIIYDSNSKHWYVFWLRADDNSSFDPDEEGVVYQTSSDGLIWSQPVVVEPFNGGGISSWDVILNGTSLYLLGLTDYPNVSGETSKYAVRELEIQGNGSLTINSPVIVYDFSSGDSSLVHFYGSLLQDSEEGYFWVAARVGDSTAGTHAEVIRSTAPDSIDYWGSTSCTGQTCNGEWINPYANSGRTLLRGTIANRLLDLGQYGVGLLTYNKNDYGADVNPLGQILFVRNPTRAHDGWESTSIVLTDRANQYINAGSATGADDTRDDDRRFATVVDPRTNIIHVAYITADTDTSDNANLCYFTLSPPYRLQDKSIETTVINKEVDGVNLSIATNYNPSIPILFYIENNHPNYQVKMIEKTETGWSSSSNINDGVGTVRYPQSPETVVNDEIVVGYQYPGDSYNICVTKIEF